MTYDLNRFVEAQKRDYLTALAEIRKGRKVSHWMWYIFPQLRGLGRSSMSDYYGIRDIGEAVAFLKDPYLGSNLRNIVQALLELDQTNPTLVFGRPDDMKLRSSMTLFAYAAPDDPLFCDVIDRYFDGRMDGRTIHMLKK